MREKLKFDTRGSITVEATIIVPIILLTVIAVIYICLLMYQQAYVQSVANQAAENGAAMWNNPARDMFIQQMKKEDMKRIQPYWRILESETNKNKKKNKIEEYVKYNVEQYSVVGKKRECTAVPDYENYIIYKKLVVNVEHKYWLPTGNMLKIFGMDPEFTIQAKSEAVINEPAEFIRNVDFLLDTGKQIDNATGGHLSDLRKTIGDTLSKFAGKLKDFLDV